MKYEVLRSLADDYFGTDKDEVRIVSQQWQETLSNDGEYQQWLDLLDAEAHQCELEERRRFMDMSGLRGSSEGKYFKASDVGDARPTFTVESVAIEQFSDFDDRDKKVDKAVLSFVGQEKRLTLSPKNLDECCSAWGEDSDAWKGRTLMLKTQFYEGLGKHGIVVTAFPADTSAAPQKNDPDDPIPF